MYIPHLILKYLRKRRIAWVSLIAVMLCTAMVIVVISVMGGWLRMFRESFHGIGGDIVVSRQSLAGFPHYDEMIERIRKLPEVDGAVPALQTFGLINVANQIQDGVQVHGYKLEEMDKIGKFRQSLYRQFEEASRDATNMQLSPEKLEDAERVARSPASFKKPLADDEYRAMYPNSEVDVAKWPGIIVGHAVVGIKRNPDGTWKGRDFLYQASVRLTVLGMKDDTRRISVEDQKPRDYWIVDDSRTKLWQYDASSVYVDFNTLQKDLGMDRREETQTDLTTGEKRVKIYPARTNSIEIAVKPGADYAATKKAVQAVVDETLNANDWPNLQRDPVTTLAWYETEPTNKFLAAVEKEKGLVVILFSFISIVAVFLIFCIFYMIVAEKTRDIGIIKAVGATSGGVAKIFLGYGLAIGLVGGGMGLLVGFLIVRYINEIHTLIGKLFGVEIWTAETYAFDTIPNTINPLEVSIIVFVAVISSLIGALVPAIRAARMNPVEALRFE